MPQLSNLTPEKRFMALFVGPKHSGKSCAACSVMSPSPSTKRVKVLDGDGRISGVRYYDKVDISRVDYDYYPPRVAGNQASFFQRVNEDLEALLVQVKNGQTPYETYVGDSATAFTKNVMLDVLPLTHADNKGRKLGNVNMAGPEDYGAESTIFDQYLSFLRSLPLNVILTAHTVDKYDKPMIPNARGQMVKDVYADSVVVGQKLSLRDKIAANTSIYFDHIFRFDRRMVSGDEHFFVEFIGDLACTSFPGLPTGEVDITGKNFWEVLLQYVREGISNPKNRQEVAGK